MTKKYTRTQIIEKLRRESNAGISILAVGAGTGLVARCADRGGADLIVVYNSGYYRMNGLPSFVGNMPVGNANDMMLALGRESIMPYKRTTPVIAGVYAVDPTRHLPDVLAVLEDLGYSGVINFPSVGSIEGARRREMEVAGYGYARECEMMTLARARDLFTMAYVYTPDDATAMARAGVDCIVGHMGFTSGGDIGASFAFGLDDAATALEGIFDAALAVRKDLILLSHGGPIATAKDAQYINDRTKAVGFVAASTFERIPIERALQQACSEFKSLTIRQT
jgi:predicted TIM-barrel enzyme